MQEPAAQRLFKLVEKKNRRCGTAGYKPGYKPDYKLCGSIGAGGGDSRRCGFALKDVQKLLAIQHLF